MPPRRSRAVAPSALLALLVLLLLTPTAGAQAVGPQTGPGALNRYVDDGAYHLVTPAPVGAPYRYEATLGYLLPAGGPGRVALHGCAAGGRDRFLSLDPGCEGRASLGAYGFLYTAPPADVPTAALYRCRTAQDHFASLDPGCEGQAGEGRLGYLRVRGDALLRYFGGGGHRVTAGPVPEGFGYEAGLGFLRPTGGAGLHPIYGCAAGGDHFLSLDEGCEGRTGLGIEGYAYDAPPTGEETVAVYRCLVPGVDHFASHDPNCEGQRVEARLGYLRTQGDALVRYENAATRTSWVTAGAVGAGYRPVRTLGFLVRVGGPNLTAIYGCAAGEDHFLSPDPGCEGQRTLERAGFAYATPPAGEEAVALYRCNGAGRGHFASDDPNCESAVTEARLGYVRTTDQGPVPPPACGPSASTVTLGFGVKRPRSARYVSFGRTTTVAGRVLAPGGAPAAGVAVSLLADAGSGALTEVGRAQTGADGRYGLRVPAGPSRTLRAAVRAAASDPAYACSATVRLRVRAGVTLKVDDRSVRTGQRVRFSGTVKGEPIPSTGKNLTLQAFARGRWTTFATPRSNRRGTFRASYRFKTTSRPTTFRFRVRAPREGAFPYARGTSRVVTVRVRPRR